MKKNICLAIVLALSLSLTACGGASSGSSPAEPESATTQETASTGEDYTGEGAVQGGIPTDEELAERNQEASSTEEASSTDSLDSEEEPDYSDANVEMSETPTSSDTFISSDNFWQGEDYFDLEEYYWMNGAKNVGYEWGENYSPFAVYNGWKIDDAGSGCNVYYIQDWNQNERPFKAYSIHGEFLNEAPSVRINDSGAMIMKNLPAILDVVIPCLLENSDKDDPFENTDLNYVHMY